MKEPTILYISWMFLADSEPPYSAMVFFLLFTLAGFVNAWRNYTDLFRTDKIEKAPKRTILEQLKRSSNLLMLCGGGGYIYSGLHKSSVSGVFFMLSWIMIGL